MLYGRKVMFRIPLDSKYKGGYIWNLAFKKTIEVVVCIVDMGVIDRHNFFFASLLMYIENVLFYIKRIYDTLKVKYAVLKV